MLLKRLAIKMHVERYLRIKFVKFLRSNCRSKCLRILADLLQNWFAASSLQVRCLYLMSYKRPRLSMGVLTCDFFETLLSSSFYKIYWNFFKFFDFFFSKTLSAYWLMYFSWFDIQINANVNVSQMWCNSWLLYRKKS